MRTEYVNEALTPLYPIRPADIMADRGFVEVWGFKDPGITSTAAAVVKFFQWLGCWLAATEEELRRSHAEHFPGEEFALQRLVDQSLIAKIGDNWYCASGGFIVACNQAAQAH